MVQTSNGHFGIIKISIPLGMQRSVEKAQFLVLHSVGMHPIKLSQNAH